MKALLILVLPVLLFLLVLGGGAYAFYVFKFRYKTVASNEVLVITGPKLTGDNVYQDKNGRSVMIQRGGGYRLKMFQTARKASLHSFQIKLSTPTVYVKEGIPIVADAVATVKVADELENIVKYAEQFMGKKEKEIESQISNVLNTNLRSILSKLTIEDINNDRESFARQVQEIAQAELLSMGFTITAFGLEDIRDADEDGYLKNLGRPRLAAMKERAEKAEAEAEKNIYIDRAENLKISKEEEIKREMEIAEIQKEKELLVQQNLAATNREKAISEQVYELEKAKREKEVEQERLAIELMKKEEQLKQEEINRQNAIIQAKREAEITKIEAEAEKERQIRAGEAEAQTLIAKEKAEYETYLERGRAEAEVIFEKGKAEAEAKKMMAEAIKEHGEVAIIEMIVKALPEMAREFAKSYDNVDEIKIIDMGNNGEGGVNTLSHSIVKNMTSVQSALEESTGIDLKSLLETFAARGNNLNQEVVSNVDLTQEEIKETEEVETSTLEEEITNK